MRPLASAPAASRARWGLRGLAALAILLLAALPPALSAEGSVLSAEALARAQITRVAMGRRHTCVLIQLNGLGALKWCGRTPCSVPPHRPRPRATHPRPPHRARTLGTAPYARTRSFGDGDKGMSGHGDKASRGGSTETMGEALPFVQLPSGAGVTDVSAGWEHTCAVLRDSSLRWCARTHSALARRHALPRPRRDAGARLTRDPYARTPHSPRWAAGARTAPGSSAWATARRWVRAARTAWATRLRPWTSARVRR